MADDMDAIPVRDNKSRAKKPRLAVANENQDMFNQERQMVHQWSRDDLEDKYLRMYEENILLKKHGRKQEDKIKRMATKLLRLVNDKKKGDVTGSSKPATKHGRDIETEEMMEDLHDKIRDLERQNQHLKDKLMVAKQQMTVQTVRPSPYHGVPSRIDTGRPKSADKLAKNMRVTGPRPSSGPQLPRYGHSVLEESKLFNKELEQVIAQQNEQMNMYEQEIDNLKEQMRVREVEYEEDLIKIKQQSQAGQRATIQENVDMIKMQREVREKTTKLEQLQGKYEAMDKKLKAVKSSHDHLLREMETQNEYLKQEQGRVINLQNELKDGSANHRRILELEELIDSLRKEMDILKEANEKLVHSAFDLERERDWRQREKALKVQIAQLEATLKADVGEKGGVLDKLAQERDEREKAEKELSEMRVEFYSQKQVVDDLREKMKYFTQESEVDFTELEEALVLVKQKKQKEDEELDFLERVEDETSKDFKKELVRVQAEFADTVHELEKTRNMLIVQHNINKDYQNELSAVTRKMEENKTEYEMKLDEYARLLDIRAARIKKLEHQLRDVAYGTKQYKIKPDPDAEMSDADDVDDGVSLERGENLFEIHITKVALSTEALQQMQDEEPTTFCTWEFFEFELQASGLLKGANPKYDFTSQYVVRVDDFFLHYLQKESATLELHQALGTDYKTVAACQLVFNQIFDKTHGRIHGTAQLMGVNDGVGVNFGAVEYWIRLRVPVDQALRLYKERTKALGYISSNARATEDALIALNESRERPSDNVNQLHVKVVRCTGVESRRQGLQPSAYAVYKFFDFPDHDTAIIPSSNQPEFQDRKVYPVEITTDVDRYLKSQALQIFVFDDTEMEDAAYLGVANVPLITLAHDKPIKGQFDLRRADGTQNGTIDVSLHWEYSYIPPRGATRTAAQALVSTHEPQPGPSVALMPGEDLDKPSPAMPMPIPSPQPQSQPMKSIAKPKPRPSKDAPRHPEPRSPARSHPRTPPGSGKGSPRDEVLQPVSAALAAEAPSPARRGSASSVRSRVEEEELQAVERPGVQKRPRAVVDEAERAEGLDMLKRSMGFMDDDQQSVRSEYSVVEEDSPDRQAAPSRKLPDDIIKQLSDLPDNVKEKESKKKDSKEDKKKKKEDKKKGKKGKEEDEESAGEEAPPPPQSPKSVSSVDSDSEGLIIQPKKSTTKSATMKSDVVTVTIFSVQFEEGSSVMEDEGIQLLFVEYRFLGCPPAELETPYPLPKPDKPDIPIIFNFSKVFHVDMETQYERRQYLASMLLPDDSDEGRIRFTVVSEPTDENSSAECEDVGVAFVNVRDILDNESDVIEQNIPLYDCNDEETVIGGLRVTVECLDALKAVKEEMDPTQALDDALNNGVHSP